VKDFDYNRHGLIPSGRHPNIPGGGPQSVADVLDVGVSRHPDAEALVGRHARYSYAELDRAANRAARVLLSLGVCSGDRVAASMANHTELVVAFLGAMRIGAIWLGINRALAPPEKAYMLKDAEAKVLLADPEICAEIGSLSASLPLLSRCIEAEPGNEKGEWHRLLEAMTDDSRPVCDIDSFAPAAIAYTSGTTGFPKGAVHSQHNMLMPGAVAVATGQAEAETRTGVCLPLTILNLMILGPIACAQAGNCCVLMDRVDAVGLAEWIRSERLVTFAAVPAMMRDLLTHPDVDPADIETLTRPGVGGASCPEEVRALIRERFGSEVNVSYGLTEAPTVVCISDGESEPAGASGTAQPQLTVHILDSEGNERPVGEDGEICVGPASTGPMASVYTPMLGYWNRAEASAAALQGGLLHTGDVGALDANGHLHVRDRKSDLIIRGGANVYPAEIERVLNQDERVVACAVVGIDDERLGERVVGAVQLARGRSAEESEFVELCRANLARYKVPERVLIVDAFPLTPMGKIRKRDIKVWFDDDGQPTS
jgi:long-chain acyl-CoA synthetase